ncbi:hypothetical protein [Streptomyces sp. CB03238]|uniref:hypothetical protein n=1 Tax=Streptomyces sp. CB03238 TaxID=1907777 RepID=UPI000A10AE25|nr:hypothetical protein [Streptomyces sp. CB03238]ORT59052.1 hypothetical protein BKD26_13520 [Streptomyces sp. CB03238]
MDAHRLVRAGIVAAAGTAAVLALAGCGGGRDQQRGDDPGDGGKLVTSPTASPSASPSPAAGAAFEGSWVGLTDGKPVSLTIKKGHALVLAEAHVCQGTAQGTDTVTLTLTCDDGYTARTKGSADADKEKLVVSWSAGVKDTLTKAAVPPKP